MTDRELMQQALEKLEFFGYMKSVSKDTQELITTLRERLAQPQMQPCAGRNCGSTNPNLHSAECFEDYEKATGMNNQQIKREWVGLTDQEIEDLWNQHERRFDFYSFSCDIEAKLKEKNHG